MKLIMQPITKQFLNIHNHFSSLFAAFHIALASTISEKRSDAFSSIRMALIVLHKTTAAHTAYNSPSASDDTQDIIAVLECNLATQAKTLPSDIITIGCCHSNEIVKRLFASLACTFSRADADFLLNDPSPFVRADFWDNPFFIPTSDDFKTGLLSDECHVQLSCIRRLRAFPGLSIQLTQRESDLLAFDYTFDYDKDRIAAFVSLPQALLDDRRISLLLSDDLTSIRTGVASNPSAVFNFEHITTGINDYCSDIQLIFANKMIDSGFIATPEQIKKGISSSNEDISSSWLHYSNWLEAKKLKDYIGLVSAPKALLAL